MRAQKTSKRVYLRSTRCGGVMCVTDMTIANSYEKSNADVGPYYEIGSDHRQSFVHRVHLQSMLSLLELALKLGSLVTNGCSTQ